MVEGVIVEGARSAEVIPTPLVYPAEGVPEVVIDEHRLVAAGAAIAAGHGPIAIDAERASGHRYGQRAYLVQLRRRGAGTWLIDPIACPDLGPIADGIGDTEWVLHAATQDLACLAEVGLRPTRLFDTELGGRLAGRPRVGLGAAVEHYLGLSLAKEHSAVDWSRRPLPEPWLRYAALDVEVLVELRDAIADDLVAQDKWHWAEQEFAALTSFTGPPPRVDPWRRTSGMHKVRRRRGVAVVRELWLTRDRIAQRRDVSPGRVLPDAALIQLAVDPPKDASALIGRRELRSVARSPGVWLEAIERALSLPEEALPPLTVPSNGPPPPRAWADRDPVAAARLVAAREALAAFGLERSVPVENVLSPDVLRRVLWKPPQDLSAAGFAAELSAAGAREWQVEIVAPLLAEATAETS
ncbi:MAG: HRDC domain-containing protein [Actinomycetales bacterium]|nr:HRDC domain-containing protein [Actinomycetales bacterium]